MPIDTSSFRSFLRRRPRKVYLCVGWFGSEEWIESVHATLAGAEAACTKGWQTRHSDKEPEYIKGYQPRGLAKFGVDEHEVLP